MKEEKLTVENKKESKSAVKEFTPKIIAFCCYPSAYESADMAGMMRLNFPAGLRIVRVPCSGRVDLL
jgi:F420-non-reducing hydrogenase iron-sulfur subunit